MASCLVCLYGKRSSLPAVCTLCIAPYGVPSHIFGVSSDYKSVSEAVIAAKAYEDGRAFELLDKSEEAIEEVVSLFDELFSTYCSEPLSVLSGTSLGDDIRGCLW